jgi:hypothetical protein
MNRVSGDYKYELSIKGCWNLNKMLRNGEDISLFFFFFMTLCVNRQKLWILVVKLENSILNIHDQDVLTFVQEACTQDSLDIVASGLDLIVDPIDWIWIEVIILEVVLVDGEHPSLVCIAKRSILGGIYS